jgi:signal transduction histidine kinase/DNA-binding response OmpR family regulator
MTEVSGKTLELFRKIAERTGVAVEEMFAGSGHSPDRTKDPEYVPWRDFCVLCRSARRACGSDQRLADMGSEVLTLPELGRLARVIQLFASAKTVYWVNKRWSGPSLFNHLGNELEELPNGLLRFTITIPPEHEDCPEFFHLNGGVLRRVPRLIGLPDSFIELDIGPRRCVYTIDPPPSVTLWARLRRALSVLFSARTAIEELGTQQSLLARRYKELQATREDLEKARDAAVAARVSAEQALAVKSQFLATMSHELRTPLNGVIGMSELLMTTALSDEQRDYASTVNTCGKTLLQLINDILDYSKLEANKLVLAASAFDVRELVENVLDMLAGQARGQGIELGADLGDTPLWIESDPHRLQQVLLNLVGNAVKFTHRGEVFVAVEELERDPERTTLRFTVRDTGIGIAPEFLPRLFSPFTQADGSNTRKYGGTGLGLAISKELVERLGGTIEAQSELGRGSVFRFTIRAGVAAPRVDAPTTGQPASGPLAPIGPYHALIVDDNPTNRHILARALAQWGLTVHAAADGPDALRALAERPCDIALLDLRMPGMDGVTLARKINAERDPPRLLMLTASGERDDARAAREAGITSYLTKPFRHAQLHAAVSQLLRGRIARAKAPAPATAASPRERGRVLVVDDNEINLRFAQEAVHRLGYEVTIATSGAAALELIAARTFDFVFMDCEMPEMDGFATTQSIRAMGGRERLPIVALTAHATDAVRARCLEVGMNDFVAKPPPMDTLRAVLARWIPS